MMESDLKFPGVKKTVYEVDYNALDKFIAHHYQLDDFEGSLESSNDTTHSYHVEKEPVRSWNQEHLERIIKDKNCEYWKLDLVLTDMCNKGLIEPGQYLVRVSW